MIAGSVKLERQNFISDARPGVRAPQQSRSEETYDRILDAARSLCDGRAFTDITVQQICEQADVSASSFYARFANRDALMSVLYVQHLDTMLAETAEGMDGEDWTSMPLSEAMIRFAELFLEAGRDIAPFVRSMQRIEDDHRSLVDKRIAYERASYDFMVLLFESRYGEFDAAMKRRIKVALSSLWATLRSALLPMSTLEALGISETELLRELSHQFCVATGLPEYPTDEVLREQ